MKLYKFRPLANDLDLDRAKRILKTNQFWCSRFSELNDPMEGIFYVAASDARLASKIIDDIYSKKSKYKICSFSGEGAFKNPTMWGYYANGFKGMVIEIEIDEDKLKRIKYIDDITNSEELMDTNKIENILTAKLIPWKHEEEYRFLKKSENNFHKIGNITAVYFGDPYGDVMNRLTIYEKNQGLLNYENFKKQLTKDINGIKFYSITIHGNEVVRGNIIQESFHKVLT